MDAQIWIQLTHESVILSLGDGKDQAYSGGIIIVGGAYVSGAVRLEEVLVAGGCVGHTLFGIAFLAEVGGWCASEPVGLVAAPAVGERRDVVLRLQIDAEKRITRGIFSELLCGREPQR